MHISRAIVVAGGCAVIVGTGYAVSPKALPTLELVVPDAAPEATSGDAAVVTGASDVSTQAVAGPAVATKRGPVQVLLTYDGDTIVDVEGLVLGSPHPTTAGIVADAYPVLRERVLEAQSFQVEYASGASFFSPGFVESVRGAMVTAGLIDDGKAVPQPGEANDGSADYSIPGPNSEELVIPAWADEAATVD